jgi:two-component system CheB/CheR fusion protein
LGQIVSNLVNYDRLAEDIQTVLDTLVPKEIEAQTKAGAWYLLGIRPYRTLENVIEGAVITFVNITELKKSQMMIQRTEGARHVGELLSGSRDAMVIFGLDGRILAWSPSATLMYGWSEEEALQRNIRDLLPEENREECLEKIRKIALSNTWDRARIQRRHQGGQTLQVAMVASPLLNSDGDLYAIATIERFASDRQGA